VTKRRRFMRIPVVSGDEMDGHVMVEACNGRERMQQCRKVFFGGYRLDHAEQEWPAMIGFFKKEISSSQDYRHIRRGAYRTRGISAYRLGIEGGQGVSVTR
jgi:hypothetical protein